MTTTTESPPASPNATAEGSTHSSDLERIATELLAPLWRGIDAEYKRRYLLDIWGQFEGNVRSAAYTSSLTRFVQKLSTRLGVQVSGRDAELVASFVRSADARPTLKSLREEATYLVLLVRVANEERRVGR